MPIPFIDLAAQQDRLREPIERAIAAVLASGQYILGPQVKQLEQALAEFAGVKHCLTCANGTDAIQLALMALGIRAGDAVFVPAFTFAATAEVVPFLGATPVMVDVLPDTFNMDPASLSRAIGHARTLGLRPACVIPVDLFGLPADYDAIRAIAAAEGLRIIADTAQGFGATYKDRTAGALGDIDTTSFYPAKPLGCYGDGGAVFTDDDGLADLLDSLRLHGKGTSTYDTVRIGMNSRLDTLQAAILIEKLSVYADEIERRQEVAARYSAGLAQYFQVPVVPRGLRSIWAQYTITCASAEERAALQARAKAAGIPTVIYYPLPLHRQAAYADFPADPQGLAVSDDLAARVLSLPMHAYLDAATQDRIIAAVIGRE